MLSGTVETPLDAKRASDLATIFVSGGEATTGQYSQTAAGGSADGGVAIDNPDQERQVSQIVNLLEIIGDDQVTLKVTVAEVSRIVMKQLGVNMIGSGESSGISWGAVSDNLPGLGKPLSPSQDRARDVDDQRLSQRHGAVGRHEDACRADVDGGFRREGDIQGRR